MSDKNETMKAAKEQAAVAGKANAENPDIVPQDEKILSMIGYFSFFCVLPLILRPKSDFCQFHGKQSLAISLVLLALFMLSPLVGWLIGWIYGLFGLIQLGLAAYGIYYASKGMKKEIPGFDRITKYFVW